MLPSRDPGRTLVDGSDREALWKMTTIDTDSIDQAQQALRSGRPAEALALFKTAFAAGAREPAMLLPMAVAARAAGDHQAAFDSSDALIRTHGHMWQVNLLKADAMRGLGRARDANTFYGVALKVAPPLDTLSPADRSELERARQTLAESTRYLQERLDQTLTDDGFGAVAQGSRIRQAIDVMMGRQRVYLQEPHKFFFPELAHRQFFDPSEFAWAAGVEGSWRTILQELQALMPDEASFVPYVRRNPNAPSWEETKLEDNLDWGAYHLIDQGRRVEANIARAPETMATVETAPLPDIPGLGPAVLFSRLRPGAHITPHSGMVNARLLCHLPLIVPDGCWFRVGSQIREWKPGELLIFDDSIEHEAKNESAQTRVVMIFDVWRPELNEEERRFVTSVFRTIESEQ